MNASMLKEIIKQMMLNYFFQHEVLPAIGQSLDKFRPPKTTP